jgi:hypothetical protein
LASFSAELLKLYKRPTAWVLLLVALALSQVFNYLVPYAGYLSADNERVAEQILAGMMPEYLISNSIGGFPCSRVLSRLLLARSQWVASTVGGR